MYIVERVVKSFVGVSDLTLIKKERENKLEPSGFSKVGHVRCNRNYYLARPMAKPLLPANMNLQGADTKRNPIDPQCVL